LTMRTIAVTLLCILCTSHAQIDQKGTEYDSAESLAGLLMSFSNPSAIPSNTAVRVRSNSPVMRNAWSGKGPSKRARQKGQTKNRICPGQKRGGRRCNFLGIKPNRKANVVTFSGKRNRKVQYPNLHKKYIWWPQRKLWVRIKISSKALRIVRKLGLAKAADRYGVDLKKFIAPKQKWYGEYKPKEKMPTFNELYADYLGDMFDDEEEEGDDDEEEDEEDEEIGEMIDPEDAEGLGVVDDDDAELGVVDDDDDDAPLGVVE